MSERDEPEERDINMYLDMGDKGEFVATPQNTILFTFMGRLALYDHVFLVKDEEEGQGTYIFNVHPAYGQLMTHMLESGYEAHLNLRRVADCDADAYDTMIKQDAMPDLDGGVPADWL